MLAPWPVTLPGPAQHDLLHVGVTVENLPAGAMSAHNDLAVVIDRNGRIREELGADPGPGTASTQSSFSVLLSQYARQAMHD